MVSAVLRWLLVLPAVTLLAGCATSGYYAQAVRGHFELMDRRVPIDELMADPATPQDLRERLVVASEARRFAIDELGLPDNGSYRSYVAVEGRAVVWNVFAAPELSLQPRRWCFPVAGCVVYRGYFREADARRYAEEIRGQDGDDTWVGGAAAYSTLGRFEDPVLSTMLGWDDARLAGLLFHELAHQRLYVEDDSAFNEAFATAVEEVGVRRWLLASGREALLPAWEVGRARSREFEALLATVRERLAAVYASDEPEAVKRELKALAFEGLKAAYRDLRAGWDGWPGYDRWFEEPLNNARLIPSATYRALVPALTGLLAESGGELESFYRRCEALAELTPEERGERLRELGDAAGGGAR
jgi:predicted aminopeptidase